MLSGHYDAGVATSPPEGRLSHWHVFQLTKVAVRGCRVKGLRADGLGGLAEADTAGACGGHPGASQADGVPGAVRLSNKELSPEDL